MSRTKYITGDVKAKYFPVKAAIAFPESVDHVAMSHVFVEGTIQGAGFFWIDANNKAVTFDKSIGLQKGPHWEDNKLIEVMLGLNRED